MSSRNCNFRSQIDLYALQVQTVVAHVWNTIVQTLNLVTVVESKADHKKWCLIKRCDEKNNIITRRAVFVVHLQQAAICTLSISDEYIEVLNVRLVELGALLIYIQDCSCLGAKWGRGSKREPMFMSVSTSKSTSPMFSRHLPNNSC